MTWQYLPIVPAFAAGGVVALAAAVSLRRRDHGPGGAALVAVLVAAAGWSLAVAGAHARGDLAGKLLAVKLGYLFVALLPVAWVVFAWRFTARTERVDRRLIAGLSVVPAVTLLAVWLTPGVSLFWSEVGLRTVDGATYLDTTYGPAFVLHTAYSYVLLGVGGVAIGRTAILTTDSHRVRGGVVLFAVLAPWVGNAAFLLGLIPPGVDPTPLGVVVGAILLAAVTVRHDLLDVPPAARSFARDTAVEHADDGVVVLTEDGVVTDCNPAATDPLGVERDEALGRPLSAVSPSVADAVAAVESTTDADDARRIARSTAEGRRHYEVTVSDFSRRGLDGRVVTLTDVTESHRHRRRVGVLNRLLRHDLRNEMNVVMGYAELLEADAERTDAGATVARDPAPTPTASGDGGTNALERIQESAEEMLDLAETVREVEATLDAEGSELTRLDVAALVRAQADGLSFKAPTARVSVDAPESAWVKASDLVDSVFENLLDNAVVHSHREHPTIDVTVEADEETVAVTVADDGPGIPEQELATFQADGESALTHSSGLGLWLVIWITEESAGEVTFDVDETGTAVTVRLPAAAPPS
ncbi:histidine kinase N-terminal 7TM domain-containing protein [Halobaculum marinum]|uniref:histidine kinase n=1 Tax=Halobaculum marinum TaxID=3031996 RepID=A0ABD5X448_9EURY|nr:histidine kinase N-terminal 7TM domain-containing protein [Halobaculum sp. DT55]